MFLLWAVKRAKAKGKITKQHVFGLAQNKSCQQESFRSFGLKPSTAKLQNLKNKVLYSPLFVSSLHFNETPVFLRGNISSCNTSSMFLESSRMDGFPQSISRGEIWSHQAKFASSAQVPPLHVQ